MLSSSGSFKRAYYATLIDAPGAGSSDFEFSSGSSNGLVSTLLVQPFEGPEWTGSFAGNPSLRGVSGVFETPSPTWLCYLSRGSAFLVDVMHPSRTSILTLDGPVRSVVMAEDAGLLLLATPWSITAIGAGTERWTTRRISVESLRLDEIMDHFLLGVADSDDDEPREFAVDLRTGDFRGGAVGV